MGLAGDPWAVQFPDSYGPKYGCDSTPEALEWMNRL